MFPYREKGCAIMLDETKVIKITPIMLVIEALRKDWGQPIKDKKDRITGYKTGIHTVYSGLNDALRKTGVSNPVAFQDDLAKSGDFTVRVWKGGAMLFFTEQGLKKYGFTLPAGIKAKESSNKKADDLVSRCTIILRKQNEVKRA
jgi:hypothetical protein